MDRTPLNLKGRSANAGRGSRLHPHLPGPTWLCLPFGRFTRMKRIQRALTPAVPILLLAYLAAYGVYRLFGPTEKHWSVSSPYPVVLINGETPQRVWLYRCFSPCVMVEDAYYRMRYRGTYTPPTTGAASETDG